MLKPPVEDEKPLSLPKVELPLPMEEFLGWLRVDKGRSSSTISAYRRDLRAYQAFLLKHNLKLVSANTDDVNRYIEGLRQSGLAPATQARRVVAVRALYRFLADEEETPIEVGTVDSLRVPRGLPRALSEEQISTLLNMVVGDHPAALRDRAILEVLYGTGVRISELVGLSRGDIDLSERRIRVFGKGSKERVVPLGNLAREALASWLQIGRAEMIPAKGQFRHDVEAVFLNARGGRLSRQGAWGVVKKYARAAGLDDVISPHVLRHSCATHMVDHGADLRVVQELLGHSSVSTTQVYTLVSNERLWKVYEQAHPRARGADF